MIAVFAIPSIVTISHEKRLLDEPNGRTIHLKSTPRLGGLAIFAGFLSALTIFGSFHSDGEDNGIQRLIAGCSVLFFIGLKDDIVNVSAFKKFFVQVLATSIVLFLGDIRIRSFQGLFGIGVLPEGISYAFSMFVIIGVTNALNLIDGLDGLAGTIICIITACFGVYFYLYGGIKFGAYTEVASCLIGGILAFLRYNMHKAVIFMGDAGALVCGYIVSVLAIQFVEMDKTPANPTIALAILFVPIYDTLRIFTIRLLQGKSPFSPDKNHIHHRFLSFGFSQVATVATLAGLNLAVIAFAILTSHWGSNLQLVSILGFSVVLSVFLEMVPKFRKVSA
ncbi:MAG: undecaprenyl/decaprenyl-phosphate alpha-N-acetylglucosaminyl 1-phosphate transferase [Verrucomicrobia bacterium]|nr:undecaprenyl/decaprenyl-phosphate alpha-N-acetylglucosaminyl 1-phosphate transferase [Cytophagales bacterium]